MAGNNSDREADMFAIPEFWPSSKWLKELPRDDSAPFFSTRIRRISDVSDPNLAKFNLATPSQDGFFKLPAIGKENEETTLSHADPGEVETQAAASTTDSDTHSDIWMSRESLVSNSTALKTWQGFLQQTPAIGEAPLLLSEAGTGAYDALLAWKDDPLNLGNADTPVVDPNAYSAALLALALGRESVFFLKSETHPTFRPALPRIRAPGYSANILDGVQSQCLSSGEMTLKLNNFVQTVYKKHNSKCAVALGSVISELVRVVQENAILDKRVPQSILQLQSLVRGITAILSPFYKLITSLPRNCGDEQVITCVFDYACSVDNGEQWLRELMQEALRKISTPWIGFLEEWIGTKKEEGIPLAKTLVGQAKGFVQVEAEITMDDLGQQIEEVDFRLKPERVPHFIPDDIVHTMFETGRNLRFIRSHHPAHPLARSDILSISKPPRADWLYDWDSILQLESRVEEYRDRLLDSIKMASDIHNPSQHVIGCSDGANTTSPLNLFTFGTSGIEERLLASIEHLNAPIVSRDSVSPFDRIIRERLGNQRQVGSGLQSTPHWSLLPILSFGSIVSTQAQVVNRETLTLLFSKHDLRGHLKLQRDFQLLGNGMFCSRLSNALFDPDLEIAERQQGVARQGGIMGLRLGARDTWPPASSELRLALMGVLSESFSALNPSSANGATSISKETQDLPGDLSFTVRDLSEEEITKCVNPNSLEALDFLRLSYTTPPELSFIITPMILLQYDRIFKLMLRLLRMSYVVNSLWRLLSSRVYFMHNAAYRFVREARHFVCSIESYFLDTGISSAWSSFEAKLDKIQALLNNDADRKSYEKLESPEQLREFHSDVLQRIMTALFLRKRQEPILKLLEEIFTSIIQFSYHLRTQGDTEDDDRQTAEMYSRFKKKVQVFITVCRGLAEKSRATQPQKDSIGSKHLGFGDDSSLSQLLLKLDISDYYVKRHS
ncbi:unnamed protein product [Clonostachys byssicola]|uniref:Spindle pole body component n=1 Tax=Clonostachys byssicola TaxID=160290 RepID=A0A9N9USQ9_9HYPO|nr:unnamed protein product [Clonostachys byssicola]